MGNNPESPQKAGRSVEKWSRAKRFGVNIAILAGVFMILFLFGEIALRIYHRIKYDDVHVSESSIRLDRDIGWVPNPLYNFHGDKYDAAGKSYHADVHQENGDFRVFGDTTAVGRKRILFLGDSYTHAVEVDNDSTFYSIVARDMGMEPFALGGGGYGTLQEYLLLKKYVALIRPDIVILQFCSNDFINNDYELELHSTVANNGLRRPYMKEDGEIYYAIPKKFSFFRDFVIKHSRLIYLVLTRLDMLSAGYESIDDEIMEKGLDEAAYKEAVEVTGMLLDDIRGCLPPKTVFAVFTVDEDEPFYSELKSILREHGIPFIDGVSSQLIATHDSGTCITSGDKMHWNGLGHRIVARQIEEYLKSDIN